MRRYADGTAVPIARSRSEIDKLLRQWGCDGIQWSDDYRADKVVFRFIWRRGGTEYLARFTVRLPGRKDLEKDAIDGRTGQPSAHKLQRLIDGRGKREHRCLLLWLRAALNAVDLGIVSAEELFLSFLEGPDGRTVGELAVPRLGRLLAGKDTLSLDAPDGRDA